MNMYHYNLALRFQEIVAEHASRTALWFSSAERYSYAELNKLANRLARLLLQQGITAGDVVAISGKKTVQTYAFILASLKIGALYTVFDPDSPAERLQKIFATCQPKLAAGQAELLQSLAQLLREQAISSLDLSGEQNPAHLAELDADNLPDTKLITGSTPAYIMYTSGSTGFPKGAVMTHAGVLNLLQWGQDAYNITPEDVQTNLNPLYFDNSVFDFYSSLFNGACLVPFSKTETRNPKFLVDKIDAAGCTLWFSVPSLLIFLQTMKATDGKYLRSIRRFVFGGEGYPKAKLKALYETYADTAEFHNVSGPTECTCICSTYQISATDFEDLQGFPPLGSIAKNFSYLILDDDGKKVCAGELGELCLLGPNVGRGYYNDPLRTAPGFVQNPYNDKMQEIMYKTGDLVRLDPADGKLYILGRKDNQIKHMGYRIELEEIETALHRVKGISEAVALHSLQNATSRIIAVIASKQEVDENRLRLELKKNIPDYMIPSVFYRVDVLPKNANGKVDRKRLKEEYLSPAQD